MVKHFRKECECGAVISQCRCISEHKDIERITHKEHLERIEWRKEADKAELEDNVPELEETENVATSIPIFMDYKYDLQDIAGYLVTPEVNKNVALLYKLLADGYTFEVGATTMDGELLSISIITHTGKKVKRAWQRNIQK